MGAGTWYEVLQYKLTELKLKGTKPSGFLPSPYKLRSRLERRLAHGDLAGDIDIVPTNMAEISIWGAASTESQYGRERMGALCQVLRSACRGRTAMRAPTPADNSSPCAGAEADRQGVVHVRKVSQMRKVRFAEAFVKALPETARQITRAAYSRVVARLQMVNSALRELIAALEAGGAEADRAATAFGRAGGHPFLLQLLEYDANDGMWARRLEFGGSGTERNLRGFPERVPTEEGWAEGEDGDEESTSELAADAVGLCMGLCPRFPMRGVHVDAEHAVDLMRCEVEIDSAINACGRALTVFLRRRANPSDTEHAAALGISNTLWAGSVLLVRYLQAFPALLPGGDDEDGGAGPVSAGQGKRRARVVEVGAGLGAGGIGVGVLARELRRCMDVWVTDCDAYAVEEISASVRTNRFPPLAVGGAGAGRGAEAACGEGGEGDEGVRMGARVLDWDRLQEVEDEWAGMFDLVVGAEIVHELSHARGVLRAVRKLMHADGRAIIVNGAPKHRFGAAEFQTLLREDPEIECSIEDIPAELTAGLESLQEGMLQLQVYSISWRPPAP